LDVTIPAIVLDATTTYQSIEGFGAAFTDSVGSLEKRKQVYEKMRRNLEYNNLN